MLASDWSKFGQHFESSRFQVNIYSLLLWYTFSYPRFDLHIFNFYLNKPQCYVITILLLTLILKYVFVF
jgi:hypothetical protein